ncbi:MAG: ribbon-helix-helix protein, CopG family [Clostridia bacterium]|nr:ribbon-helix-helix protein, CopG family [Clostridia bacterium]
MPVAEKITVYVDENLHRRLKAAASLRGQSLSDFMLEAARRLLEAPDRRQAAAKMDRVRSRIQSSFNPEEVQSMREEGRP